MKKILVVGAGQYQLPLIKRITELGYEAYCVDGNPSAPGFAYATHGKHIDVLNKQDCLSYANEINADAVVTYGATITLPTVAFIGKSLGLPTISEDTAEISKSKFKIKQRLFEFGCNTLGDFFEMHSLEDAKKRVFSLPCVIKPSDGSGSTGVSLVMDESQLDQAIMSAYENSRYGTFYAEPLIKGEEFTVEAFVSNNSVFIYSIIKTTFSRDRLSGEISYGHRTPSGISDDQERLIEREITKAIKALNITMASVNFDVILSEAEQKPYIIDCGIRIGQNLIASHIVPLSRGVSIIDNTIMQALGESIYPEPKFTKCIATRLLIYKPGVITQIKDFSEVIGKNGVIDVVLRKSVGDTQNEYRTKSDTCGWVIATGATPDEAEANAEQAKKCLENYIIIT